MENLFADRSKLELQLLLFAASYKALKHPNGTRSPEEYVRLAAVDVKAAYYGFDLDGQSIFEFMALSVAHRIDEDARGSAA